MEAKFNLSFFLKDLIIKDILAPVLDLARISNMGERQFLQYERCIKDRLYEVLKDSNDALHDISDFETVSTDELVPKLDKK